jgi:drug/metabolite transporter (DMT)-like permease
MISTFRFLVGFAVLFGFFYARGGFQPLHMLTNPLLILRGILGGFGVWIFYLTVIKIGAGRATFISNTYVVFGAAMAAVFLKERLTPRLLVSLVLAMVGLALLTGVTDLQAPGAYEWLGILGAIIAGAVVVSIRKLHQRENSSTIFGAQCLYGLLIAAGPTVARAAPLALGAIILLVLSGLLAAFGQLAMTRAYKDLPVGQGSVMQLLLPPTIAIGGMIFFGETYSGVEMIGAGLILFGCLLTSWSRPRLASGLPSSDTKPDHRPPPIRPVG